MQGGVLFCSQDSDNFDACHSIPHIPDTCHPCPGVPASSSRVNTTFAMIRYLHDNYHDSFQWFLLSNDNIYIRGEKLQSLLRSMDSNERVFLGRGVTGRESEATTLELLPGERYCMGGPGMVLSSAALQALSPQLEFCLGAVEQHNRMGKVPWTYHDVELGRCVSRTLNVQCSGSSEVSPKGKMAVGLCVMVHVICWWLHNLRPNCL